MNFDSLDSSSLQDRADALRLQAKALTPREQLLGHSLEELEASLEELRVAEEELRVQNEALRQMIDALDLQNRRYRDLFYHAPEAYLVTDVEGLIQEVNQAAENMLHLSARSLVNRPLQQFIGREDKTRFRTEIFPATLGGNATEWFLHFKIRGSVFPAALTATSSQDTTGRVRFLRWLIRVSYSSNQQDEGQH